MKKIIAFLAGAMLMTGTSALATPTLDFGVIAPSTGSISYAGGSAPLVGTEISVDNVVGLDTVLLPNQGFNLIGAFLNFQSGNLTGSSANSLQFGGGPDSFITLTGTVDINNDGTENAGDIIDAVLMQGSFGTASVSALGGSFKISGGSFTDFKNPELLALFGLPTTLPDGAPLPYEGFFNISFNAGSIENGFTSTSILSGDIVNTPVPEPGTMLLLGAGFLGLAIYGKRRKNA